MTTRPKADWSEVRLAYLAGKGSLRELSERYQIPLRTLERRCSQERWRATIAEAGGAVAATAKEVARKQGQEIGMQAAELVERTVTVTEKLLDEIERRLAEGRLTMGEFRSLIAGWKDVTAVGRTAFGLDDLPAKEPVRIGGYLSGGYRSARPVDGEPVGE